MSYCHHCIVNEAVVTTMVMTMRGMALITRPASSFRYPCEEPDLAEAGAGVHMLLKLLYLLNSRLRVNNDCVDKGNQSG